MNGKEFLDGKHTVTLTGRQWAKLLSLSCFGSGSTVVYTELQHSLGFVGYMEDKMDEFFSLRSIRDKLLSCRHGTIPYNLVEDKVLDFFEILLDEQESKEKQKQEIQEQIEALQKQLSELENS